MRSLRRITGEKIQSRRSLLTWPKGEVERCFRMGFLGCWEILAEREQPFHLVVCFLGSIEGVDVRISLLVFAYVECDVEIGTVIPATFACLDRALLAAFQALYGGTSSDGRPSIFNISEMSMKSGNSYLRVSRFDRLQTIASDDEHLDLLVHVWTLGEAAHHEDVLEKY